MGFFVGQVMKRTRGQANPQVVNRLLREKLSG
jgi:aspartyl-tRNA(Asn)/glutamyl-tRNA(Gln) amidotransferase subunit B